MIIWKTTVLKRECSLFEHARYPTVYIDCTDDAVRGRGSSEAGAEKNKHNTIHDRVDSTTKYRIHSAVYIRRRCLLYASPPSATASHTNILFNST